MTANPLLIRRLFRSLLKVSKPFTKPSPYANVITSLLHRSGAGDDIDLEKYIAHTRMATASRLSSRSEKSTSGEERRSLTEAQDLSKSYARDASATKDEMSLPQKLAPVTVYFRMLLRDVIAGPGGAAEMKFPSQVDSNKLRTVIRREFRTADSPFDNETREKVAFIAYRQLNMKLSWFKSMNLPDPKTETLRNQHQAARNVYPLPLDPASFMKPGTFLIVSPHARGYFRQSVLCILDHSERSESKQGDEKREDMNTGTYGLVVNRPGLNPSTGRDQTLTEVFRKLPHKIADTFGECSIRHGGPVHLSLQMLHGARPPSQPTLKGKLLERIIDDDDTNEATNTDRKVYFQGDLIEAADAVTGGKLDRDDISFFVGATCWEVGQLECEVKEGFWLPCRGPPEMALTGACDHVGDDELYTKDAERPKADLWLSLMCAMGNDEATLAHLFIKENSHEFEGPCDDFDSWDGE